MQSADSFPFPPAAKAARRRRSHDAGLVLVLGITGMLVSFFFLASPDPDHIVAGVAGFIAGAVLVAGAVIARAIGAR